jgi:hypothetical protein
MESVRVLHSIRNIIKDVSFPKVIPPRCMFHFWKGGCYIKEGKTNSNCWTTSMSPTVVRLPMARSESDSPSLAAPPQLYIHSPVTSTPSSRGGRPPHRIHTSQTMTRTAHKMTPSPQCPERHRRMRHPCNPPTPSGAQKNGNDVRTAYRPSSHVRQSP